MATVESITANDLLAGITEIEPLIREHSAEAEQARRLSLPVVEALKELGCFRMCRPRTRCGLEFDPVSAFRIIEELARIDSAVGWNVSIANACESFGGWLTEAASDAVYGSPDTVLAGSFFPPRKAVAVDGGYRLSGRSPFNSNCNNATVIIGLAHIYDGDKPRLGDDDMPITIVTFMPADEVTIVENWDTLGMCGTGSHDVQVEGLFLPEERTAVFVPIDTPNSAYNRPFHKMGTWSSVACNAVPALGVAQAAIDDLVALGSKVPAYTERSLRDRSVVQRDLAVAAGKLGAARAFLHTVFDEAWQDAVDGKTLDMPGRARCQLAISHAVTASAEAVDLVHGCVGATGIRNSERFQRYFRDVHVLTQHAYTCENRLESVGQVMFGLEPEWPFFQFS